VEVLWKCCGSVVEVLWKCCGSVIDCSLLVMRIAQKYQWTNTSYKYYKISIILYFLFLIYTPFKNIWREKYLYLY